MHAVFDLAVIGGGINGTGIAADAAGRGLKVALAEMGDLGSATSSASSKLIHGGLRYLEQLEFRLVREALQEREVLLAKAGHIVRPMRFILPQSPGGRSALMLRAGLFLYDHLARRRRIPRSGAVDLARDPAGGPLRPELERAFAYWDCWVDDARLVVANAQAAAERGALILTRARVENICVAEGCWQLSLESRAEPRVLRARVLVNAAGPWADVVDRLASPAGCNGALRLRLVKGSHIVVPRIAPGEDAYLFQSEDGRVVFSLPFEEQFTLIGTTDVAYDGDPGAAVITPEETRYLLDVVNRYVREPIRPEAVVWSYSGVRPLYDDASAAPADISRDYRLALSTRNGTPLLTVIGGKITTYRKLAEAALSSLSAHLPSMGPPWTATAPLPGGDLGGGGFHGFLEEAARRWPWLDAAKLRRLARRYGARLGEMLGDARREEELGAPLGGGLTAREVDYLKRKEWARTPEDVLWRRTKAGLHIPAAERAKAEEGVARLLQSE